MRKIFTLLFIASFSLVFSQSPQREYLKDRLHDETREKPVKVYPPSGLYTAPPADATVLFDGTSLDAWSGPFKLIEGSHMVAHQSSLISKETFGDVQLHLEWRMNDTLRVDGQKGGNSGVYIMGLYEVQILESFINTTYADGQAGAIYGQYPPLVNASLPQGKWNSYDIFFKAPVYKNGKVEKKACVTVLHNGVIVQLNQEYEGPTVYRKVASYPDEHPEKGPIMLQYHSDPVEYRNIWVRDMSPKVLAKEEHAWEMLFPEGELGKLYEVICDDEVDQEHFVISHNQIDVLQDWKGEEAPYAMLATRKKYDNFNLELEYKWGERKFAPRLEKKRDAGIIFHVKDKSEVWPSGVECQIQEDDTGDLWLIKGPQVMALKEDANEELIDARKKDFTNNRRYANYEVEGWNHVRIEIRANKSAKFYVNGHLVNSLIDIKDRELKALKSGYIVLQAEAAELSYRNVRIQEL